MCRHECVVAVSSEVLSGEKQASYNVFTANVVVIQKQLIYCHSRSEALEDDLNGYACTCNNGLSRQHTFT